MTDEAMWNFTGDRRPDFAIEPGPGQESVWDYPRPPALDASNETVEVRSGDLLVARTTRALRLRETASPPTYYLPPDDVNTDALVDVAGSSVCEWKGAARYWALATDPAEPVGWSYPPPRARYKALADYVAFYPARLECLVDGHRVEPQPGRFYGGWITPRVVGPFKGEPGTGHW
jgi:uncharacterized protein (DUF427 family)